MLADLVGASTAWRRSRRRARTALRAWQGRYALGRRHGRAGNAWDAMKQVGCCVGTQNAGTRCRGVFGALVSTQLWSYPQPDETQPKIYKIKIEV